MDDDILEQYRIEAAAAMEIEAKKRIEETIDTEREEEYRKTSLLKIDDLVPYLLARLGQVRAALDGHGGGIAVVEKDERNGVLDIVLDLSLIHISEPTRPY